MPRFTASPPLLQNPPLCYRIPPESTQQFFPPPFLLIFGKVNPPPFKERGEGFELCYELLTIAGPSQQSINFLFGPWFPTVFISQTWFPLFHVWKLYSPTEKKLVYILSFISCSSEKELNKLEVQGENGQQFTRYFTRPTSEKPNQADGNPLSPAEDPLELNTQVIKLYRGDHSSKYFVLTKVSWSLFWK